jgi:hypothetical protein
MNETRPAHTCVHKESHSDKSLWVKPTPFERKHSPALKRPYCLHCGKIKYIGSARIRKMGYFHNLLREIRGKVDVLYRRKISKKRMTDVQIRLIVQDLERDDFFSDDFCNNSFCQWEFFKETVKRHCAVSDEVMEEVHREFKG